METPRSLAWLLANAARRWPTFRAVEEPERGAAISYRDLDLLSDGLRDLLIRHGVRPADRVGIYAPKSLGSVISIFGVLKAAAAYVPVDPTAPPERNAYILRD